METLENIICVIVILTIFSAASVGLLLFAKYLIIYPLSSYYTKRGKNKLQWKAIESETSREDRINQRMDSRFLNDFYLEWRILPSELPYIVRVYGYNNWERFIQTEYIKFKSEQEFKHFVSDFKTLKDLREYYNKIDNKIVWYEP
jgi:hypothetical protein